MIWSQGSNKVIWRSFTFKQSNTRRQFCEHETLDDNNCFPQVDKDVQMEPTYSDLKRMKQAVLKNSVVKRKKKSAKDQNRYSTISVTGELVYGFILAFQVDEHFSIQALL